MPLYSWRSTYLKAYGTGLLIAQADTPDAARTALRADFEETDRERYSWDYDSWGDAHDQDERDASIAERRALFEQDLLAEPTEHVSHTLFVRGSE